MDLAFLKPLPVHISSRIAAELCDRILDQLHDCKEALSVCSTVCSSWLPTCRYHLFTSITLHPTLVQFLQSSSHAERTIAPYIRHAVIASAWSDAGRTSNGDVVALLQNLANLVYVRFEKRNWELLKFSTGATITDSGRPLSFQNLRTLDLHSIQFPSFMRLAELVGSIPAIEALVLDAVSWDTPRPATTPASTSVEALSRLRKPMTLRKLHIASGSTRIILSWLWYGRGSDVGMGDGGVDGAEVLAFPPALNTLILPDIIPAEAHSVGPFLRALGPCLEHLELGFVLESDDQNFQDVLDSVNLAWNRNLKYLSIHQITLYQFPFFSSSQPALIFAPFENPTLKIGRRSRYAWLSTMLSTIESASLSHLTFHIWLSAEPQLELIDWVTLNSILTNDSFECLTEIRFLVSGIGRDLELVRGWFRERMFSVQPATSLLVDFC